MPLFKKKAPAPSGRSGSGSGETDWRSFDSVGDGYARVLAPNMARVAEDLVGLLEVRPGQRVLDIGTGTGTGARAATHAVGPDGIAAGVDPSIGMLLAARREGDGQYAAADSIDLPFRNATFDHVMANFVVAFFPNYKTALFDVLRVLRPGGRMAVSAWASGDEEDEFRRAWRGVAEEFAEREVLADATARGLPWAERFADRDRLKETLHDAGLRDIWTEVREYRFEMSREDWITGREIAPVGRFLRQMLGAELWEGFRSRTRKVFAERFPSVLNDFRQVNLAVGHKP